MPICDASVGEVDLCTYRGVGWVLVWREDRCNQAEYFEASGRQHQIQQFYWLNALHAIQLTAACIYEGHLL